MNTLTIIQEILQLSGPFLNENRQLKHQAWLEDHSTEWLLRRRLDLNETAQRPCGQAKLGLRYAR